MKKIIILAIATLMVGCIEKNGCNKKNKYEQKIF